MFIAIFTLFLTLSSTQLTASEADLLSVLDIQKKCIQQWSEHHNFQLSPTSQLLALQLLSENILHSKTSSSSSEIGLLSDRLFPGFISYLNAIDNEFYSTEKLEKLHQEWSSKLEIIRQKLCPFEIKHPFNQACKCAPSSHQNESDLLFFIIHHQLSTVLYLVKNLTFEYCSEIHLNHYLQHMLDCPHNNTMQKDFISTLFVHSKKMKTECCAHICMPKTPDYTLEAYSDYRSYPLFQVQSWLIQHSCKKSFCRHNSKMAAMNKCYDCYEKYK
ncbi:MAG: hypothetical protein AB8C84_00380 [Oligoflexales bacterium]